ncbi:hypothetical protein DB29_02510 [Shouchella clausii]|nr:hypothetical protein DB29_02510 [Shouchella clausii]
MSECIKQNYFTTSKDLPSTFITKILFFISSIFKLEKATFSHLNALISYSLFPVENKFK